MSYDSPLKTMYVDCFKTADGVQWSPTIKNFKKNSY